MFLCHMTSPLSISVIGMAPNPSVLHGPSFYRTMSDQPIRTMSRAGKTKSNNVTFYRICLISF